MINAIYVVYGHKEEYCGNPPIVVMATASIEDAIREVRQQQNEVALEVWRDSKRVLDCYRDNSKENSYVCSKFDISDEEAYEEVNKYILLKRL